MQREGTEGAKVGVAVVQEGQAFVASASSGGEVVVDRLRYVAWCLSFGISWAVV